MSYHFTSLERYLMDIQKKAIQEEATQESIFFKYALLQIRLGLHDYISSDSERKKKGCFILEVSRKQIKVIKQQFVQSTKVIKLLECLLDILDALLDLQHHRKIKKSFEGKRRHIMLGNINITREKETIKGVYERKLIYSTYTIAKYLSMDWPSEMYEEGERIDQELQRNKALLEDGLQELLAVP